MACDLLGQDWFLCGLVHGFMHGCRVLTYWERSGGLVGSCLQGSCVNWIFLWWDFYIYLLELGHVHKFILFVYFSKVLCLGWKSFWDGTSKFIYFNRAMLKFLFYLWGFSKFFVLGWISLFYLWDFSKFFVWGRTSLFYLWDFSKFFVWGRTSLFYLWDFSKFFVWGRTSLFFLWDFSNFLFWDE